MKMHFFEKKVAKKFASSKLNATFAIPIRKELT